MALSAAFLAFFFVGGVLLKGSRPGIAVSATGGFALFVLLVAFVDPFALKVPVTPLAPRAALSITPIPDTIKVEVLAKPAEYPDVYGFSAVTYEFRETAGTDVDIQTQNFQFFTQDGRPVGDQCKDCRVFKGGFTVRGRGIFRYVDNHALDHKIVARARELGVNSVNLKTTFLGEDGEGRHYAIVAVLLIYF
ncbi:MAG TPA: hypothetical protein VI485_16220 [Vicinamibacterales bacterium]|nr:hypothetical protein [Vicinamibacterales bacterium]